MLDKLNIRLDKGAFKHYNGAFRSTSINRDPIVLGGNFNGIKATKERMVAIHVINRTAMNLHVVGMDGTSMTEPPMHNNQFVSTRTDDSLESVSFLVTYTYPSYTSLRREMSKLDDELEVVGELDQISHILHESGTKYINDNPYSNAYQAIEITVERSFNLADFFNTDMTISGMMDICSRTRSKAIIISTHGYMLYLGKYEVGFKLPDLIIGTKGHLPSDHKDGGAYLNVIIVDNSDVIPPYYMLLGKDVVAIPIVKDDTLKDGLHYYTNKNGITTSTVYTLEYAKEHMMIGTNKALLELGGDIEYAKENLAVNKLNRSDEVDRYKQEVAKYKISMDEQAAEVEDHLNKLRREHDLSMEEARKATHESRLKAEAEKAKVESMKVEAEKAKAAMEKDKADMDAKRNEAESKRRSVESTNGILKATLGLFTTIVGAYALYQKINN